MNKKLKKSLTISTAAAMGLGIVLPTVSVIAAPAVANGWVMVSGKWYFYKDGTKVVNNWAKDSKGWCFMGADGSWLKSGWAKDSHGWCYIGTNGYWIDHAFWASDSKGWCYIGADGYWVDHAAWAQDSKGWQFIGENGYWDGLYANKATNPIADAEAAVVKAEGSKSQADVEAANALVAALHTAIPERVTLSARLNAINAKLSVQSVSVINATTIEVNFTQTTGNAARLKSAYIVSNTATSAKAAVSSVAMSSDGKKATLTLGTALVNKTGYTLSFNNITNANEEIVAIADKTFSTDFSSAEPTVTADAVTVLRNGDDAANISAVLSVKIPAGCTLADPAKMVSVTNSADASIIGSIGQSMSLANNILTINLGNTAGVEAILAKGSTYKVKFAVGALKNEYNVSNTKEIVVQFTATEATLAKPKLLSLTVKGASDAGTALTIEMVTDVPVNVSAGVIGKIYDEDLVAYDLTAAAIAAGSEASKVILTTVVFAPGTFEAGKSYTVTINPSVLTSALGAKNDEVKASANLKIAGVDTTAPILTAAQINSPYEAVFAFDDAVKLKDNFVITFAGKTFSGASGNDATVFGNIVTLTSEDGAIPTAIGTGLTLDVTGGVENLTGVGAQFNKVLTADDKNAANDSTNQSFLVDNAAAKLIKVLKTNPTTITFVFSEDVTATGDSISVLIGGKEYDLNISGTESSEAITVTAGSVSVGDTVYIPAGLKGVEKSDSIGYINTTVK